ncbi:DUF2802 domain-containing protein [Motiliproteus sp.]|uniref:DUF2802 domain-containing protein n=1 Tax=Motiliproteus sp. TaxID=1898955 RepID=UPI003BAC5466
MTQTWLWLAITLLSVGLLVSLYWLLRLQRRLRDQQRNYEALLNVLRNEIRLTNSGAMGMGRRLKQVEQRLNITAEKQLELENRDPGALAYNQAAKLMEMGADVDDLVGSCGIARPEAELMALLHREIKGSPALKSDR